MEQVRTWVLTAGAVVLALLILATLVRAVLGPRFTDRIVAVNVISTLVIAELVLLSVWLREDFLVDVALVFVSFSMPPDELKQRVKDAAELNIPVVIRGMVNGDMRATANAVAGLVKESNTGGVQIDPTTFRKYNITAVPVLIVACGNQGDTVDRLQGDLTLHQALKRVAEDLGEPDLAVAGFAVVAVGLGAIVNSLVIAAAVGGDVAGLAGMGVAEARWGEVLWMGWAECHGASGSPHYLPSRPRMALQAFNVNDVMPVSVYTLYCENQCG